MSALSDDTASFWKSFSGSQIPGASVGEKRERDNGFTNALEAINSTSSTRYNSRLSRESVLSKAARANQEKALRVLANDLNRDLRRERTLRERESREVLGEAIDAARTLDLTSPDPILLSAEEQLELTNLRLKLLPSSQISPEEEAVARRRYRVLQGRWDEALRRQEAQYRDEIEEQREVEPRRLRHEGEAAIAQSQSRLQIADSARLRTLSQSQRELLARDFTMWQPLRNSSNRLSLSPIATSSGNFAVDNSAVAKRLLRTNRAAFDESSPRSFANDISFSNNAQMPSRVLDVATYGAVSNTGNVANSVAALRAQARRDAQIWAQIVAQREGWQRSSPDKNAKTPLFNATEIVWRAWQR